MPGRLNNKVAVITGASSGLGRAIALAYSAEGAHVVCADLRPDTVRQQNNDEELRGTTHERITKAGGTAIFVKTDITNPTEVESLIGEAVRQFGRLDIMVNNAGVGDLGKSRPIWETTMDTWETTQNVNGTGVFLGIKFAAAQMIKQDPHPSGDRGWIINLASILGLVAVERQSAYCASKGLVVNLTRAAALDCAPHRIHVNAIGPGFTESNMTDEAFSKEETKRSLESRHPFRGLGKPEDLAKVAVFLASEDAQWVSGVTIPVDGGYVAR